MGEPMARNLLRAGVPLRVWNRSPGAFDALAAAGVRVAASPDDLFAHADTVLLMLRGETAIDSVLGRGTEAFAARLAGRRVVHLGTTSPEYSEQLAREITAAGGRYVEAPVSGSRGPAEHGALVGMVAGATADVDAILPLLAPLCRRVIRCGPVPGALRLKLAVNHYLITTVAALAEAAAAAAAIGVDAALWREVLDAGPMASEVSRAKLAKLQAGDLRAQAAIDDVAHIAQLVLDQANRAGARVPLMTRTATLFGAAQAAGDGALDMAAVYRVFQRPDAAAMVFEKVSRDG